MVFSFKEFFFGGTTFCCCLPVRIGVIIMSVLGIIFSGILSIVVWYEVASTPDFTTGERAAFVLAGLLETLLFVVSILGLVGAIVRKQLFVMIYAYFTYVHLVLNVAIAGFLLYQVTHLTSNAASAACQKTISNPDAQDQCVGLLKVARGVYFAIATFVLLAESYGAFIVARYLNQIKSEKRLAKAVGSDGYNMRPHSRYTRLSAHQSTYSLTTPVSETLFASSESPSYQYPGFDQPRSVSRNSYTPSRTFPSSNNSAYEPSTKSFNPYDELNDLHDGPSGSIPRELQPYDSLEIGYGGGSWTHSDISVHEKTRLRDSMADDDDPPTAVYQDPFTDTKASVVPPAAHSISTNDLPRYTPSETNNP